MVQSALEEHTPKRRSRIWANVLLACGSTLLSLVAIEIGLRVIRRWQAPVRLEELDARRKRFRGRETGLGHMIMASKNPRLVYEFIPRLHVRFHGTDVRINSSGYRDDEFSLAKPPHTIRIAALGDSVGFGWKVAKEETCPEALEQILNRFSNGARFEVMNFAVPGYNTAIEREVLVKKALPLQPDIVLLQFSENDADLPIFLKLPENPWRLDRCYLWEFLVTRRPRWVKGKVGDRQIPLAEVQCAPMRKDERGLWRYLPDDDRTPLHLRNMVGEENCKTAIRDIGRICREKRIPTVFVFNIDMAEGYSQERPASQDKAIAPFVQAAREAGFAIADPTVPTLEFLREHGLGSRDLWVDPAIVDAHPSPPRHTLVAMQVAEAILDNRMLPPAAIDTSRHEEVLAAFRQQAASQWAAIQRSQGPRIAANAITIMPDPIDLNRESRYLLEGWYPREVTSSDEPFRWCTVQARLRLPPAKRLLLKVDTNLIPHLGPPDHVFLLNGQSLPYRLTRSDGRAWIEVPMPNPGPKRNAPLELTIQCSPADLSTIPGEPRRDLALLVYWIVVEPL